MHTRRLTAGLAVWLATLVLTSTSSAQSTTAVLQGRVVDQQQGAVPGVTVLVRNVETGFTRETVSDGDGRYRATALPPGTYELRAELPGFAAFVRTGLVLTIGQDAEVEVKLALASQTEEVVVTAAAPLVDATSNALGTTVTKQQLDDLPLSGRDFAGLANLAPGVTGVGGGGINAGGQLSRNNSILIDGANTDDNGISDQRGSLSLETVREYVVYTNQFSAEYGQASGAIVNVVTRAGTNAIDGRLFAFQRNDSFDAQDPFSKAQGSGKAPFSEYRAGGYLGGPILRDRLHYFASYERFANSATSVVTSPLVPVDDREQPRDADRDQFFARVDYQLNRANSLSARYRLDDALTKGLGIGGLNPRERGYDQTGRFQDSTLAHTAVLSSRAVNELRVLYGRSKRWYSVDGYADPSSVSISRPSINLGKASNMPQGWNTKRYQFTNSLGYSLGRHELKAGVDVQIDRTPVWFLGNKDGTFTFRTDAPYDAADPATHPIQFTRTTGDWFDDRRNEMYTAFVQDSWRVHDRLTVNLGLRYDTETLFSQAPGVDVARDADNVAPRVGFVLSPLADGRTVVRGGYGRYFDQGFNNITGNIGIAFRSVQVTVVNPGYPDPYAGGTIVPQLPSNTIAAPRIDTPWTETFSLGVKRELLPGLALSLDATRTRGHHLFNAVDVNAPDPVTGLRPNPDYLRITQYQTTGRSWTDALLVGLERRAGDGLLFNVAYTLSRTIRDVQDFGSTPADPFNPAAERALANNDRRHQFVGSVVYRLPWDVQLAGLVQARSGLPWTVTTGVDNNGDTNINDRPDLAVPGGDPTDKATYDAAFTGRAGNLGRNTNTGPAYVSVDARVSKFVRLGSRSVEGFVEAFNLLNSVNLGVPVGNLRSAVFGQSTSLASGATPRQVEIGVRFNF